MASRIALTRVCGERGALAVVLPLDQYNTPPLKNRILRARLARVLSSRWRNQLPLYRG